MTRRLRIAVSIFFAVPAVLLCVLWVRSYWWYDALQVPISHSKNLFGSSAAGGLAFDTLLVGNVRPFGWQAILLSDVFASAHPKPPLKLFPSFFRFGPDDVFVPHWFLVIVSTAIATLPWLHWSNRFSLRNMLIATTLLAVVLGLAIWLAA